MDINIENVVFFIYTAWNKGKTADCCLRKSPIFYECSNPVKMDQMSQSITVRTFGVDFEYSISFGKSKLFGL